MKVKIGLILLFCFVVGFKIYSVFSLETFNREEETALFWTESALQYRNAKLVAIHGYLPALDQRAQYPEGLDIKDRLTVLMEIVTGYTYRLLIPKTVSFHTFVIIFISIFSSLAIIPLYLSIKIITKNRMFALYGSAIYALTPAIYTTVTAPGFEYQDFALPLIFLHLYLFIKAMNENKNSSYAYAFCSAGFLFAAFAAWHLTQFYYLLFVLFISICYFYKNNLEMRPFFIITAVNILAGLLIPTQRSAGFLISFSMLISYLLVFVTIVAPRLRINRRVLLLGLFCLASLVTLYIAFVHVYEYRFVYGLILDKIKHFGIRPKDPTGLSWETLVMWVSPFSSPSLRTILTSIGALLVLGITGIFMNLKELLNKKAQFTKKLFFYFAMVFLPLYLILIRLDAFLVWFLSFHTIALFKIRSKITIPAMLLGLIINAFLLFDRPARKIGPTPNYLLGVIKYIRNNVLEDSPVLTTFAYGPSILTYTGRPILLHPKFEAEDITRRIKSFEHSLFGNEDDFFEFCKINQAEYFVYQTDILLSRGTHSIRYRTHNLELDKRCVSFKFHFHPEELKRFQLLYTNPHYRIYRVLEKEKRPPYDELDYFRVYDERLFNLEKLGIY